MAAPNSNDPPLEAPAGTLGIENLLSDITAPRVPVEKGVAIHV